MADSGSEQGDYCTICQNYWADPGSCSSCYGANEKVRDKPVPIATEKQLAALSTQEARIAALLPHADCGCPTSFNEKKWARRWEATHEVGCLRMPVRRREAIEHTRSHDERTRTTKRR